MLQSQNSGTELLFAASVPEMVRQRYSADHVHCQMCGIIPGDIDEYTGGPARFYGEWIPNNGLSSDGRFPDLRILCSTCNQGAKNITAEKPTGIWLLSQVRRSGMQEQKAVFDWLSKKFGK
jgi:hypothetical protein